MAALFLSRLCVAAELGARVPLIIRAPWIEASIGKRTAVLAELIDIFPTVRISADIQLNV